MKNLILVRGVSGAGKSTIGKLLAHSDNVLEADQYFMKEGVYNFDPTKLRMAHETCQEQVKVRMRASIGPIAVCNTFTTQKEMKPYLEMAAYHGYVVTVIVVENYHESGNVHDVPEYVLENQERKLKNSIKLR